MQGRCVNIRYDSVVLPRVFLGSQGPRGRDPAVLISLCIEQLVVIWVRAYQSIAVDALQRYREIARGVLLSW